MSAPNPTLLSIYGTGSTYLEKQAGLASLAGRVGLALVAMKAIDSYHQSLVAQQVASEQRAHLERRNPEMDDVIMRMRYSHPPIMVAPLTPRSQEQTETEYGLGVMPGAPVGMDSGMVRLAMVGENVGKLMAKKAALAPTVAPGMFQQMGQSVKNVARQAANKLPGAVPKGATGTIAAAPVKAAFEPLKNVPIVGKNSGIGLKYKALGLGAAGLGAYGLAKGTQAATGWGSEEAAPTNWSHTDYGAPQLVKNVNEFGYT